MKREVKEKRIKKLAADMLKQSHKIALSRIDKAIKSGALDIESWEPTSRPMILPKIIVTAILKRESQQYDAKGTSYEKEVKKEVANLMCFI